MARLKLKSSSILEVVVAMIVISIIAVISFNVLLNLSKSVSVESQLMHFSELNNIADQIEADPDYVSLDSSIVYFVQSWNGVSEIGHLVVQKVILGDTVAQIHRVCRQE